MVVQLHLHGLVDLALCDPELGAVNFNHLRTLLHCMLRLTNHGNNIVGNCFVENIRSKSKLYPSNLDENLNNFQHRPADHDDADTDVVDLNISSQSEINDGIIINQSISHGKLNLLQEEDSLSETDSAIIVDKSVVSEELYTFGRREEKNGKNNNDLKNIVLRQNNLEMRVLNLERNVQTIDEIFPSNSEILNENNKNLDMKLVEDTYGYNCNEIVGSSLKPKRSQLFQTWQNKKIVRRLEATEETVDKLFSLMNDLLEDKGSETNNDESNIKIITDECIKKVNICQDQVEDNKSLITDYLHKVDQLNIDVNEIKNKLLKPIELSSDSMDKEMLYDNSAIDEKANSEELEKKVVGVLNFEQLENRLNKLIEDNNVRKEIKTKIQDQYNEDSMFFRNNLNILNEQLLAHISKTNDTFSGIQGELDQLQQAINKPPLENTQNILESKNSNIIDQNETSDLQVKYDNVLDQMKRNKEIIESVNLRLDDLVKVDENLLNSHEKIRLMIPTIDTSVLVAIQHVSQENRNQITSLQSSLKIMKEREIMIPPVVSSNISDNKLDLLDVFQKHLLSLQDEQIKQSSQFANVVDDYKEEFNRKQLHIDALYDYIEKLQNNKADKEEVNVEMNVKADKQALDSKVNMSTFDERYQLLEHSLQQALSLIDQYAKEENLLKSEFTKLSEEMNLKMNSDAEKKLKKIIDSRLNEIQDSQSTNQSYVEMRNAAGLRKPMPLSFNCLSCDRPIDVKMRGVMPPIPNHMPSKNPLKNVKNVDNTVSDSSYYSVNRPCGGQHTSVNINMLRLIKLNPLSVSDSSISKKNNVNKDLTDCVVGKDGQIYRGRYKLDGSHYVLNKHHSKDRLLKTRSAKTSRRHKTNAENRPHSAEFLKGVQDFPQSPSYSDVNDASDFTMEKT